MAEQKAVAAKSTAKTPRGPIELDQQEMAAGMGFQSEVERAQTAMQQATMARQSFVKYLKAAKGCPPDWEVRDWEAGIEPPVNR